MKRLSPNDPKLLLAAMALVLPALAASPALAGTIGGGGGEIMGYRYELYLQREAEAEARQKKTLAETGAQSPSQQSAGQKAGIGTPDFSDRPAIAMPLRFAPAVTEDWEQDNRHR